MESERKRIFTILYGSQTGTAQDVAERVGRDAVRNSADLTVLNTSRMQFESHVKPMDDYDVSDLPDESLMLFVCATTGQGEEPDNMKKFWSFLLRKSLPANSLSGMNYGVLGLGDSSYQKFNFVAKRLHKRLHQLGARPLLPVGLADDQHDLGPDAVTVPFLESFYMKVLDVSPLPPGVKVIDSSILLPPKYEVKVLEGGLPDQVQNATRNVSDIYDLKNPWFAEVIHNKRVTATDHWQDVRLISFNIEKSFISYVPGDVAMIMPKNSPNDVQEILDTLELNGETVISIHERNPNAPLPPESILPSRCSLWQCFQDYLDIKSVPKRYFFELLSKFTPNELERERLQEFCSPEGANDVLDYCIRPKRSIVEALQDFPHATQAIPLEYLFDLIPSMKPRAFSIASSPKAHPGQLQVLVAVVQYRTKIKKPRLGVCSNYLAGLKQGDKVVLWVRKGTLRFPKQPSDLPVVMIGPGTGVAPFHSYILDEFHDDAKRHAKNGEPGRLLLFFGSRNRDKDYFFQPEYEHMMKSSPMLKVITAFSRDQDQKIYVQHRLREHSALVWDAVDRDALICIAGNSKQMPEAVREAIRDAIKENGGMTEEDASAYLARLEARGRLQMETWS
ncbi:unnamed protein product [Darwinula stevensoni]|uniref:NADPH-dependent diflavin oxidoreductase 1 n=1 Tax=Darwinula stevensoni TaxID=69355 RepID=A0A7R9A5Z6_9CRUS|nr:unnamed protein product [Darwinula stevensoni]CAG0893037.1 unnamed protein product [Darwinula stevensoni]